MASVLTCYRLTEGRVTCFRPKRVVASFLHLMMLSFNGIFYHTLLGTQKSVTSILIYKIQQMPFQKHFIIFLFAMYAKVKFKDNLFQNDLCSCWFFIVTQCLMVLHENWNICLPFSLFYLVQALNSNVLQDKIC